MWKLCQTSLLFLRFFKREIPSYFCFFVTNEACALGTHLLLLLTSSFYVCILIKLTSLKKSRSLPFWWWKPYNVLSTTPIFSVSLSHRHTHNILSLSRSILLNCLTALIFSMYLAFCILNILLNLFWWLISTDDKNKFQ